MMSKAHWRLVARAIEVLFQIISSGSFVIWLILAVGYYPGHRPHVADLATGQIERLPWTNPASYGSQRDAWLLSFVFELGFYSLALFGTASAIRIYILDEDVPTRRHLKRFGRLTRKPPSED